jgi:hypothetical protein
VNGPAYAAMSALSPVSHAIMFIVDVLVLAEVPPPVSWVADCLGGHVRKLEWLLVVLLTPNVELWQAACVFPS